MRFGDIFYQKVAEFFVYVRKQDGGGDYISFEEKNCFLWREEYYKSQIRAEVDKIFQKVNWSEKDISTGIIAKTAKEIMAKCQNLVSPYQIIKFKDKFIGDSALEAERAIYEIYYGDDEEKAFVDAASVFGSKYDVLSYLFFIKDASRFLPTRSAKFEEAFHLLGIDYEMKWKCSWENYMGYIDIIKAIQTELNLLLPMKSTVSLLNAHSFVWVVSGAMRNWIPDKEQTESIEREKQNFSNNSMKYGDSDMREYTIKQYIRSRDIVQMAKNLAHGKCQLCGNEAPFRDKENVPYLESHHIVWRSRSGQDELSNVIALCPNCHARMHILDLAEDIGKLKKIVESRK